MSRGDIVTIFSREIQCYQRCVTAAPQPPGGPSLPPGLLEKTDKEKGPVDRQQNGFPLSALVPEAAPQAVKQEGGEENNDHDGVNP